MTLEIPQFSLGKLVLSIYGKDEVLSHPRQYRSSIDAPGRVVNGKWSTLHEIGKRKLIYADEIDAHSFTRNFYNMMVMMSMDSDSLGSSSYAAGALGMKGLDGTVDTAAHHIVHQLVSSPAGISGQGYRGGSGSTTNGILAGTGTTAFTFNDFALDTLIAEGTGSGQMSYVAMDDYTASNVVYNGGTLKWTTTYERFMNNNSGGSIVVEEVGLVADHSTPGGSAYLMARDLLGGSALTIADAGQLKVTYTIVSPAFPS